MCFSRYPVLPWSLTRAPAVLLGDVRRPRAARSSSGPRSLTRFPLFLRPGTATIEGVTVPLPLAVPVFAAALMLSGWHGASAQVRFDKFAADVVVREDVPGAVTALVGRARTLQSPADALAVWGDPASVTGAASPVMLFRVFVGRDGAAIRQSDGGRVGHAVVELSYAPLAAGQRRLDDVFVSLQLPKGQLSAPDVVAWLGQPRRRSASGKRFEWDPADDAGRLGIVAVELVSARPPTIFVFARGRP